MASMQFFEDDLYPTDLKDGRADKCQQPTILEIFKTNYFGSDQIYLKLTEKDGKEKTFHLTKDQAHELAGGLEEVVSRIAYDNS